MFVVLLLPYKAVKRNSLHKGLEVEMDILPNKLLVKYCSRQKGFLSCSQQGK